MMNFGAAIRKARALRDVSQVELDQMTGLSCVAFIETGRRTPSLRVLELISKALKIPMYVLVLMATPRKELGHLACVQSDVLTQHLLDLIFEEYPTVK